MKIMDGMMKKLRADKVSKIAGRPVVDTIDYLESTETTAEGVRPVELPKSNVLEYLLDNGCTAIVRPSGTEPKIKLYLSVVGKDMAEIDARAREIGDDVKKLLGV